MRYGVIIGRDALPEFRQLEFWLQEEILDELEELADDPPPTPGARLYRMIRLRGADVETTFLRLDIDDVQATITLVGVNAGSAGPGAP